MFRKRDRRAAADSRRGSGYERSGFFATHESPCARAILDFSQCASEASQCLHCLAKIK
jgi:hypothetical protein